MARLQYCACIVSQMIRSFNSSLYNILVTASKVFLRKFFCSHDPKKVLGKIIHFFFCQDICGRNFAEYLHNSNFFLFDIFVILFNTVVQLAGNKYLKVATSKYLRLF